MQNVSNLVIPEGNVDTIHDKDNKLIWGRLAYDTKYAGNTIQNGTPTPTNPINVDVVTGTQTVTVTGKNLFDISKVISNDGSTSKVINNGDGTLFIQTPPTSSSAAALSPNKLSDYCPTLQVGDTVTLSFNTTGTNNYIYLYGTGANILWSTGAGSRTKTITQPMLDAQVLWYASGVGTTATISNIQIEKGNSVTLYESYQGHSYTVNLGTTELCKIGDYQDYIYKNGDDWYVHKAIERVILNGSETWNKANVSFQTVAATTQGVVLATNMSGYSNYFVHHYYASGISSNIQNGEFGWSGSRILTMRNDDCADANAFKTWLGTHNTSVYYQLATPTDTQITDTNLITQLNNIHQFLTRYGYNSNVSGNLPIIIDKTDLS